MEDRVQVSVLPPLIPLTAIAIGFLIDLVLPVPIATAAATMPAGIFLVAGAIVFVVAAARELAKARTAFDVRKPTTCLVRRGVFQLSRNPIYLSMLLLCVGISLLVNSLALLASALLAGSALCLLVIKKEERYLEQKFGSTYLAYKIISPSVDLVAHRRFKRDG